MHLAMKHRFKLASLLIVAALVGGMIVLINLNGTAIHDELVTLYLLPQPEKLTELYFNDNANLPKTATSNQEISFAFVIHNLEAADYQYDYDVSVDANGTRHIVDSGKVLVKDNQYFIKNEKIHLLNSPASQEVIVDLTNKQQLIDFKVQLK